ncbi:MAG: hypothetical protein ACFE9D_10730 [Promethearchaeota archaeon]
MADEGTSSTLVLIAAIIQIIFFFVLMAFTALITFLFAAVLSIPPSSLPPGSPSLADLMNVMLGGTLFMGIMTVVALIFSILWLMWRSTPSQHRAGLIVTGILGLLFAGFLPGLLVLIAGAIAPSESTTTLARTPASTKKEAPKPIPGVKYCPACGNPVADPDAQFCGVCGASLT